MSLDVKKDWEDLKSAAVRGIADVFPIEGRRHVLSVSDVSVDDNKDMEDFEDQLTTKLQGKTWAVPIKGNVYLHDKDTGTLLNKRKLVLGHLPKTTPRFSYIVDGNEYQVDHLWVRKPGVYSRISEAGDLQSEFNLAKGRNFKLGFDPTKKDFHMEIAKNKIPLYPILKNLNVDEKILLKTWGKDVIENARKHNDITALKKLNRALGGGPETRDAIVLKMLNSLDQTQLDPTTTEITLGRPFEKVTPHTMVAATEKLINISKGVEDPDDRDSLIFKKLQGVDDKIYDRLAGKNKFRIDAKIRNRIDKYSEAKDVLGPSFFDKFIKHQFLGSGKEGSVLSNVTPQTNPIDWMQGATKTTILAPEEGGVASEHQIISEMKKVDPSHMGFLDPIQTPESSRSGITLYLPIGTKKEGEKVFTPVFDKNDKRMKYIDPLTFFKSTVAFPDQVTKEGTNINPVSREVRASLPGNKMTYSPWKDVQYVIANPASIFSVGTNLVPFVNANSGSRTALVSRNMSQSIPLVERTAPLVQVSAQEHKGGDISWEEFLGSTIALRSPATGIVKRVTNNKIEIETPKGTVAKQIYDYFPLNEDGSFVNHIPLVKPGDRVKEGDIISDTNFTKDGTLALGTNLRIAWTTIPGKTFEDGLVVSESAAKKLQAERLYRYTFEDSDDVVYDKNKFRAYYPTAFGQSQLQKLSDSGIITKGQVLQPDDPIVTSMTKTAPLSESKLIQRLGRSTIKPYRDTSIKWDGAVPGEVLDVKRVGKRTTVLVKATEPARVADKLSSRYGSKGVISDIFSDSEMPKDAEGRPIDIIISPLAVPSRLNIGHIYEALTGKVAEKTGKPIKVPSFTINNYHTWIENLLKKHKLSDTETLYAPDGRPLGNVMTGTSHILRLKQVVEDKYSDRSGGPGSAYDINKSPAGESGHKGQAMGELDQYALLSHGARNIITDAHTRASDADQADEVWRALQLGLPLPPPRIPFVYRKFENYLKGLGVNLKKGYGKLSLAPMTDADVKNLAVGEIKNPETLRSKDLQPVPGGLFDPRVTKGMGGDSWAYYKLPEPMPNPVFEEGIRALTGLTKEELNQVIKGERGLPLPLKKTSAITVGPDEGLTGPEGLKAYMDALNVDKEIDESLAALPKLTGSGLNKVHKRIRTLQALKTYGMKPSEAYMMQNVPVVPPVMRPVMVKPDGNLSIDNLNELYRGMIITSQVYDDAKGYLPAPQLGALRGELYDGLKALSGVTSKKRAQGDELKGILDTLSGETPKCYDHYTKILTEKGWLPFPELKKLKGLRVATINPKTLAFEWQHPTYYEDKSYNGIMLSIRGLHIDLLVTPNHRHWVQERIKGSDFSEFMPIFVSKLVTSPKQRRRSYVAACSWHGENPYPIIPGDPGAFASFLGFYLAEGWLSRKNTISISQNFNSSSTSIIEKCIILLKLPFKRYVCNKKYNGKTFSHIQWDITNKELATWIITHCGNGSAFKKLSSDILNWNSDYLELLIRAYLMGDGSYHAQKIGTNKKKTWTNRTDGWIFSTTSYRLFEDLQHLCVKIGWRCFDHKVYPPKNGRKPIYYGSIADFPFIIMDTIKTEYTWYKGRIYSVTVPNGTVVVKRNKKVSVSGNSSFFQNNLMKRRQDLSARSVISPDPSLGIDEVRLPRKMAMTVYKPFVVRELHSMGIPPLYAQKMIDSNSPLSFSALDKVVKERPVLLKRDPVLHKYGIMAFRPVLHEGKEIAISPLIVGPYGADFDGDQMAVYSPISPEAVKEAWGMLPSKNLFSPASGQVAYKPSHESVAGLFRMTHTGKATNKAFSNLDDAKKAFYDKNVAVDDIVTIGDTKTTVGRAMLYDALPAPVKDEKILTDFNTVFDKKGISNFLENVGRVNPSWYSDTAKTMLNLGNQVLYDTGYSLSLDDLRPDVEARKKFIDPIKKQLKYVDPGKMIGMLGTASKKMLEYHQKKMEKNPTDLYLTTLSGKPSLNQYQQLVMTPVLFSDMGGTSIPNPVSRSYSEGLEFGDYWLQNIGSRRDIVGKVSEVREPGALTKRMVNTLIGTVVTKDDCGTTEGEALGIGHPDLVDRFLSKPIEVGGSKISAGTLITPEFVNVMKRSGVASIPVRSPLHCHADDGICAKCYGLIDNNMTPKIGDNVGVMAAQSIGERATQLSLKRVHHAGAYGGSSKIMDGFSRMDQLARLPEKIPDTAVLSTASGKITDVKKSPVGGYDVFINGQAHYVPLKLGLVSGVKSGAQVKKGDPLSQGNVNPRDLLELSGIEAVRKMMTDEMDNLYDGSVRRRNFEVFVNGLTSLVQVTDPGEATEVLRGDVMPLSRVKALNSELSDKIRYKPILKGVDMAPHDIHDDWIARLNHIRLKGTLLDAINRGLTSNIHSLHPIPALVSGQMLDQGAEY